MLLDNVARSTNPVDGFSISNSNVNNGTLLGSSKLLLESILPSVGVAATAYGSAFVLHETNSALLLPNEEGGGIFFFFLYSSSLLLSSTSISSVPRSSPLCCCDRLSMTFLILVLNDTISGTISYSSFSSSVAYRGTRFAMLPIVAAAALLLPPPTKPSLRRLYTSTSTATVSLGRTGPALTLVPCSGTAIVQR